MAKHYRRMIVHGDHLEALDVGPPWTVLWDTTTPASGVWSVARAVSEHDALERAAHFIKLGFVVHAIKDPAGAVFMDHGAVTSRFAATEERPRRRGAAHAAPPAAPGADDTVRRVLRGLVEDLGGKPGRAVSTAVLLALLATQGIDRATFDEAVSHAESQGWLGVATDTLTLTSAGYAAAQ
jgi:hypothetical protein